MKKKEHYQLRNGYGSFMLRNKYAAYNTLFASKRSDSGWSVNPWHIIRDNAYVIMSLSFLVAAGIVILGQM